MLDVQPQAALGTELLPAAALGFRHLLQQLIGSRRGDVFRTDDQRILLGGFLDCGNSAVRKLISIV